MSVSLNEILDLVGPLDDSPGEDTPRERFRRFLHKNVHEVGEIRDHIEQCLRTPGEQYNRALQDLINFLGEFLGFTIEFGRYRGVQNQIGFDGLWKSSTGLHVVVEAKTTEVYAVKTATLVGYIDELISAKRVSSWDSALGLYVIGKPDPELRQLENAIIAEKRTHQLRVISVESLLSLAEIMSEYDVTHNDVLVMLRPSGPGIDALADLIARLVAEETAEHTEPVTQTTGQLTIEGNGDAVSPVYWITPVKDHEGETAVECVKNLVATHHIYAFGERTPGRRQIKAGDGICFYATTKGIVAHANVASPPEKKSDQRVSQPEDYPYICQLKDQHFYPQNPIVLNATLREQLNAFEKYDHDKPWSWFVQATHKISEHDFHVLTRS